MKILIHLPNLGPNKFKITSGAEEAHELLEEFRYFMHSIFPACCVDTAITELADDIERAEMEDEFHEFDEFDD